MIRNRLIKAPVIRRLFAPVAVVWALSFSTALVFVSRVASSAEPDLVEMAIMSDGVELKTAVHMPDPGVFSPPWPTVLLRTPYPEILGQLDPSIADMVIHYMVDMFGIALVVQDTRGTGGSGGEPDAFFTDWRDGPETVEWLACQDWCNGQVMQFGLSALAIPGYLSAPGAPDEMKCQYLGEAAPDMYSMAAFHGGVFKKSTVESWLSWVGASSRLSDLSNHRNCDNFWDTIILDRIPGDIHTAAMHIGGWYDVFTEGTIAGFRAYRDRGDEWARNNQYMVIGPWDHWELAQSLGVTESNGYAMQSDMLAWVSYCLAGDDSTVRKWPHVRYYVMGPDVEGAPGNEWRSAPDWPLPTSHVSFPAAFDGTLQVPESLMSHPEGADGGVEGGGHRFENNGDVEDDAGSKQAVLPAVLPFSHASPSPVVGGRNLVGSSGRRELSKVLERDDWVMFTTAPLEVPFESIGRMSLKLSASTRFKDADIVARLADVYPDGSTWLISDGAIRLSRREGCAALADVVPATAYDVEIDLLTSAVVFDTGHRIAVILTTTMYPKYELNPELEAESRTSGPIGEALTIHGLELVMPVAGEIVEPPEQVETADSAIFVESSDEGSVVDIIPEDPGAEEVSETSVAETPPDSAIDASMMDVEVVESADLTIEDAQRDVEQDLGIDTASDTVSADAMIPDGGYVERAGGGCSSGPEAGIPVANLLLLLIMLAFLRLHGIRREKING